MGPIVSMFIAPLAVAGQQPAPAPTDSPSFGDIVVTARPGAPPPLAEPVEYLRRHCFDPMRLAGAPSPPEDDPDWTPLDGKTRRKFGAADPAVPAYGLRDERRGRSLLLKMERLPGTKGWRVVEDRCTLVVIGGRGLASLRYDLSALMRAAATMRHVGAPGGTPALPGWRQWLWSGMPSRRTTNWQALKRDGRGSESAWLHVFDPDFYSEYDYILADLKLKEDAERPMAVLTFSHTYRPRSKSKATAGVAP